MFQKVLQFIFGSKFERDLKRLTPIVTELNSFEPEMQKLSNEELKGQTKKFKDMLANGKTLDDILPEAFATIREVSVRVMGLRHYDVQMMGGIAPNVLGISLCIFHQISNIGYVTSKWH